MTSTLEVQKGIHEVASACTMHWKQRGPDTSTSTFKAFFVEGKRRQGISQKLFNHVLNVLSAMTCWTEEERQQEWTYYVVYEVPQHVVEGSNDDLKDRKDLRTTIECTAKGNHSALRVSYLDKPPLTINIGPYAALHIVAEKGCNTGQYIAKNATFSKMLVEARKTFTFHEHFDWQYTLTLRYCEPYYETAELVKDVVDKDLFFRDPPTCLFDVSCRGAKDTQDATYFTDSFLCKVMDLLPAPWRMATLNVRSPPCPPPGR